MHVENYHEPPFKIWDGFGFIKRDERTRGLSLVARSRPARGHREGGALVGFRGTYDEAEWFEGPEKENERASKGFERSLRS